MQNAKYKAQSRILPNLKFLFSGLILLVAGFGSTFAVKAQTLDNMTNDEDSVIRDTEEMDARMDVYVHIIDRRFLALNDPNAAESKQAQKDLDKYGKLRTGTPAKLNADIARTLEEAIGKIDDVAERDQKNPLFAKSVRILTKACERWVPMLKTSFDKASDDTEKVPITNSMQDCSDVIEAAAKLPKDAPKDKKKSKDDYN